jgi:hypothetical protein
MYLEEDFKIGDIIRNKKTGKTMEVVGLPEIFDVDSKKYCKSNKVIYSTFEENKNKNTIGEINVKDIEHINEGIED